MQTVDFIEGFPGKLVPSVLGVQAFVPAPLPPAGLQLDWRLAAQLAAATRSLGELAGVARTLPNPHLLINPFIRREAVLSSRIEGTRSTLSDLVVFEAGAQHRRHGDEDVHEVANYVKALEFGRSRLGQMQLGLELIRDMHRELMRGVRGDHLMPGDFRIDQNWIGGPTVSAAAYVPPPVQEMVPALDALERFFHAPSDLPPLVRIALIHYQFEAIHPFEDGNGRIGRLLLTLLLLQERLLPDPLLYLSAYFEKHRRTYYDLLLAVSQRGAWNEWISFFLAAVEEQAQDAISRSQRLIDLKEDFYARMNEAGATASMLRLVDRLFARPAFTIADVSEDLGLTHRGASLIVDKLLGVGMVAEMTGNARNRVFACIPILEAVGDSERSPREGLAG